MIYKCNKCEGVFEINILEPNQEVSYAVCALCGTSGYKALTEIEEEKSNEED